MSFLYDRVLPGRFIARPNRFVARVEAAAAGVEIAAYDCAVAEDGMALGSPVPVVL